MGKTYRHEKEWGRPRKNNDKKKKGHKLMPFKQNIFHEEVDEDEREVIAYEEKTYKRPSNKPFKGF